MNSARCSKKRGSSLEIHESKSARSTDRKVPGRDSNTPSDNLPLELKKEGLPAFLFLY
jgi:hypothetical protein